MPVVIAPQYTQRILQWGDWKAEQEKRDGIYQVVDDLDMYTIWFYDTPDAFVTFIYKGDIPDTDVALGRTQGDNDAAKTEFETSFLPAANATLNKKATSNHVAGVAAAKGLGGYLPNPSNTPYQPASEELVSLYVDGEGSLVSRGAVLTDEGSFRNDFSGDALATVLTGTATFALGSSYVVGSGSLFTTEVQRTAYVKPADGDNTTWGKVARIISDTRLQLVDAFQGTTVSGSIAQAEAIPFFWGNTTGQISVSGSKAHINSGVSGSSGIGFYREGDYGPMKITGWLSLDSRKPEQRFWFGFQDEPIPASASYGVICEFSGSSAASGAFVTFYHGEYERTEFVMPSGSSSDQLKYTIYVTPESCYLDIGTQRMALHELHIPGPYDEMNLCSGFEVRGDSTESVASIDCVLFQNFDLLATKPY